jgi:transcriptional regulator with XRE-family HTH domain
MQEKTTPSFGQQLSKAISLKGISKKELAKKAGIHQNSIINYTSGKRTPPIETIDQIAKSLDMTTQELLHGVHSGPNDQLAETTGEDLVLVQHTVDELLAGEPGFTPEMKAELYGLALDELRELRTEGRESRFRRRLERLVSYSRRLAQKGHAKEQTGHDESGPSGKPRT